MNTRRLFSTAIAILLALACQLPTACALEDWERDRERYASWIDSQWHEQPEPPAPPVQTSTVRYQPPASLQRDAYRRHAWFGGANAYYPRAVVPASYGATHGPGNFVEVSPLDRGHNYKPAYFDDSFCSIFGIDPLDCIY
jgi:hypothetical protein